MNGYDVPAIPIGDQSPASADTSRRPGIPVLALAVGAVVGASALGLLSASRVGPWPIRVGVVLLVALALPLSRHLSGRLVAVGSIFFGTSLAWWAVPVSVAPLSHGVIQAASVGAVAGVVVTHRLASGRLLDLVPEVKALDVLPVIAAGATALFFRRPLLTQDVGNGLAMLVARWDNSSHAYLAGLMHDHGWLQPFLGASFDGTGWGFAEYPTGYHSAIASLMDLMVAPGSVDRGATLLAFWHAVALVLVMVVAGTVAALTATPIARQRPLAATVTGAALVAVFLFGPGFLPVADGHQNVPIAFFAFAMVCSAMLSAKRVWDPGAASVAVAGVVTAAGSWAPIGGLAALGGLALVFPLRWDRWKARRSDRLLSLVAIMAGVAALLAIFRWATSGVTGSFLVSANGGVSPVPGNLLLTSAVAAFATLVIGAFVQTIQRPADGLASRIAILGLVPMGAMAFYASLAHQQIAAFGELRYYAVKLGVVACVLACVYVAFATLVLAPALPTTDAKSGLVRTGSAVAVALALQTAFGPGIATPYLSGPLAPGSSAVASLSAQAEREVMMSILAATDTAPASSHVIVLSPKLGALNCARYTVALESMRGTYTLESSDIINRSILTGEPATAAFALLRDKPTMWIVTDSSTRDQWRATLVPELSERLLTFG